MGAAAKGGCCSGKVGQVGNRTGLERTVGIEDGDGTLVTAVPSCESRHVGVVFITSSWAGSACLDMESGSGPDGADRRGGNRRRYFGSVGTRKGVGVWRRWVGDKLLAERDLFFFFMVCHCGFDEKLYLPRTFRGRQKYKGKKKRLRGEMAIRHRILPKVTVAPRSVPAPRR